jgi:ketosteroid isomerase-like protein
MSMRSLLTLVGLAVGFALPTFAQEQNTIDPEVRQQIETAFRKYTEAFNQHDAAAMGDRYTLDAVEVWFGGGGLISGREEIVKALMAASATGATMSHRIIQMCAVGDEISAIGEWTYGVDQRGHYEVLMFRRAGDDWQIFIKYVR